MSNKVAKWKKWIDLICHDCGNVMLSRDMFLDLHKMIEKNEKMHQSDYFHDYMKDTYVAHATMMIRKHAKTDKDSISLASLAKDILDNKDQVKEIIISKDFSATIDHFTKCAKKIEAFADRVIAHRDRRAPSHTPTYNEVNEAIDSMDRLSVLCSLAVGGDCSETCKPTVQDGWLLIFREMGIET